MSLYYFIIDKDHINEGLGLESNADRGFGGLDALALPTLKGPVKFRLYDDDKELYYEGRLWHDDSEEAWFAPLDWAMNDAGCTMMTVFENGEWKGV